MAASSQQVPKNTLKYFFFSAQKIDCGYSLEPPRRGGSNEYPQSMFLSRNKNNDVQNAQTEIILRMCKVSILSGPYDLHSYILQYTMIMLSDSEGPDQTARIHRLNWAFAVSMCP